MSPLAVRRYRAERLLRAEFRALQARVTGIVARRLAAAGRPLDERDLEACYASAWQGLYEAILQGREVSNPTGWLVLVTYRRAVDEHRARAARGCEPTPNGRPLADGVDACSSPAGGEDVAAALDDRDRLRQLFEGLRTRLSPQEREAAVLCYLHGLTRSQAAATMGISEARMRRLMDGRGPGREGASGKLGVLVASIREGRWCEQQASLMRGLAFGILDRRGERYRLALAHSSECPACRAYVASLRGLAEVLPPALLPGGLAASLLARAAGAGAVAGSGAQLAGSAGQLAGGGGTLTGAGAAGAAGTSGWVLAGGPLGAKLAAGCLLALGIGAGCVGLGVQGSAHGRSGRGAASAFGEHRGLGARSSTALAPGVGSAPTGAPGAGSTSTVARTGTGSLGEAARASREFGPEASGAAAGEGGAPAPARAASVNTPARSSSRKAGGSSGGGSTGAGAVMPSDATAAPAQSTSAAPAGEASSAEREFAPG